MLLVCKKPHKTALLPIKFRIFNLNIDYKDYLKGFLKGSADHDREIQEFSCGYYIILSIYSIEDYLYF
jgi:hypothetical protein